VSEHLSSAGSQEGFDPPNSTKARDTVIKMGERAEVHLKRELHNAESMKTEAPVDWQVISGKRVLVEGVRITECMIRDGLWATVELPLTANIER
jgi:hypothetical protein